MGDTFVSVTFGQFKVYFSIRLLIARSLIKNLQNKTLTSDNLLCISYRYLTLNKFRSFI